MGLGIYITGEPERSGLLRRRPSSETLFDAIKGAAADLIDDSLTRRFFLSEQGTSELALFLHPAEENVDISYDGRDVTLSAKTSSAGPGYHAWLVNFVDHIGERVGITWDWRDGDEDSADETDYHSHRDFGRLQAAMANWLQEFSKYFLNESDLDSLNICLPLDFSPVHEHFAISPMGVWEREWFECVIRADADEIGDIAQTFFPAWRRSGGCPLLAQFWSDHVLDGTSMACAREQTRKGNVSAHRGRVCARQGARSHFGLATRGDRRD